MSGFYSASQFDHAFKPTRLGNWEYGTNPWPGKRALCSSPSRVGSKTGFIGTDNGHLCPSSSGRKSPSSPWGDYALHIWEMPPFPCCCLDKHRHHELYRRPADIYITPVPPPTKKGKKGDKTKDPGTLEVDPSRFAKKTPTPPPPIRLVDIDTKAKKPPKAVRKKEPEFSEKTQILLEQRDAKRKKRKESTGGSKVMGGLGGGRGVGGKRRGSGRGQEEPITYQFMMDSEPTPSLPPPPVRRPVWRNN